MTFCDVDMQAHIREERLAAAAQTIINAVTLPPRLVTLVLIYVHQQGVGEFCQALNVTAE